jgi:hypothetical protein
MERVKNSVLLRTVLISIYNVASRRTSSKFADETIGLTIKTLERKYNFLRHVDIKQVNVADGDFSVNISSDIDNINPFLVGKAIEALVSVVYNYLDSEAGQNFVTELKELAGDDVSRLINDYDADLDQILLEQHHTHRRCDRKKASSEEAMGGISTFESRQNLIDYDWGTVSHWKHDPGSKFCTLYDKQGKGLDRLNLDRIIKNYVEKLSGYIDVDPREIEKESKVYAKEYELLKLLLERDIDAEKAMYFLKITRNELNNMIRKLSQMEMLQYSDYNTIELTDVGIDYLSKKDKNKQ